MSDRRRHLGFCPRPPHKRQYREALDVLLDHQRNPRTIRSYVCPHCGKFHATSQPLRES